MKNKEISSLTNPELKFLISLRKNKIRRLEKKSLAEGYRENIQLINSDYDIDTLYICNELFVGENNSELIEKFRNKNVRIVELTKKVFSALSYRDKPDGLISLFFTKDLNIENVDLSGPVLVADAIEKPGNLGTMIRTARAFNFLNIISSDGVTDIYNPNVVRNTPPLISKLGCEVSPHKPIKCFIKCTKSPIKFSDDYCYRTSSMLCNLIKKLQ